MKWYKPAGVHFVVTRKASGSKEIILSICITAIHYYYLRIFVCIYVFSPRIDHLFHSSHSISVLSLTETSHSRNLTAFTRCTHEQLIYTFRKLHVKKHNLENSICPPFPALNTFGDCKIIALPEQSTRTG